MERKVFRLGMLVLVAIPLMGMDLKPIEKPLAFQMKTLRAERFPIEMKHINLGITHGKPYGMDNPPWTADVRIPTWVEDDGDDQFTSMAADQQGVIVCYQGDISLAGNYTDHAWILAKTTDNGSTWDNEAYFIGSNQYDVLYPEIAVSSDGEIWVWGSLGGNYNNDVIWLRTPDGGPYNDIHSLDGFYWFGAGNQNGRTYPEVVFCGDQNGVCLSTWTYDDGVETVVSWIYNTDDGDTTWNIYNLTADGEPDGMTSIGLEYDGSYYIAIHGWEENAAGDWNVNCMIDTLYVSAGLSGWGTSNPNADRYPSVFCTNGYAYIAYQADVGGGDNDILFNYSTDYGV
ncbi:MAG TPA: hypothetical protein EYP58_01800, partial [bacterium (Candidatus Stahlbacteria)]|nr:hypothetical protein [Candidatus Stahlbacteria bacterium]